MTKERIAEKPEPFLTLVMIEDEGGIRAECPELGIGLGCSSSDVAKSGIASLIEDHSRVLLDRNFEGTLPVDRTEEHVEIAKNVLGAINKGFKIEDLFK